MAGDLEAIAARLADEVIAVQTATGEERFFTEVAKVLGASSQTLEEAFLTAIRIRMAEKKAREFIAARAKDHGVTLSRDD